MRRQVPPVARPAFPPSPAPARSILHVDMDAFYVGVELRRRPELRGKPVVVGGDGARGVVAAASYEARRYGVHSALSSVVARRRCPQAVFLPGDHELYSQVSAQVRAIFDSFTPLVEPLSLDEAFLDVSGAMRTWGSMRAIGDEIRRRVADELDLSCCVGGGPSKFIAKLASKAAKPRVTPSAILPGHGVLIVAPDAQLDFLHPLPVGAIWGVGPKTLDALTRLGVRTVADLAVVGAPGLQAALGKAHGLHLHRLAWAIDDRPVVADQAMKSVGHEETFATDLYGYDDLRRQAVRLADAVAGRLRAMRTGARTITLKVKYADFTLTTRSTTSRVAVDTAFEILAAVDPALHGVDGSRGVRLLGISAGNLAEVTRQLSLDALGAEYSGSSGEGPAGGGPPGASEVADWVAASGTIDAIRERFGSAAIGPASAITAGGLRLVRRGAQQWGPGQAPAGADDRAAAGHTRSPRRPQPPPPRPSPGA